MRTYLGAVEGEEPGCAVDEEDLQRVVLQLVPAPREAANLVVRQRHEHDVTVAQQVLGVLRVKHRLVGNEVDVTLT